MLTLWLGSKGWVPIPLAPVKLAWPWYSLLGCAIAFGTGWLLSLRRPEPVYIPSMTSLAATRDIMSGFHWGSQTSSTFALRHTRDGLHRRLDHAGHLTRDRAARGGRASS